MWKSSSGRCVPWGSIVRWLLETLVKPWHPTLLGVAVLSPFLYFGLPWDRVPVDVTPWVTVKECKAVQVGMTEKEVKAILRKPSTAYMPQEKQPEYAFWIRWNGDGFRIYVYFDAARKVARVALVDVNGSC